MKRDSKYTYKLSVLVSFEEAIRLVQSTSEEVMPTDFCLNDIERLEAVVKKLKGLMQVHEVVKKLDGNPWL